MVWNQQRNRSQVGGNTGRYKNGKHLSVPAGHVLPTLSYQTVYHPILHCLESRCCNSRGRILLVSAPVFSLLVFVVSLTTLLLSFQVIRENMRHVVFIIFISKYSHILKYSRKFYFVVSNKDFWHPWMSLSLAYNINWENRLCQVCSHICWVWWVPSTSGLSFPALHWIR